MKHSYLVLLLCLFMFSQKLFSQTYTAPVIGIGSEGDPYQIATVENLNWISASDTDVPEPARSVRWAAQYLQTADIDFSTADPAINTWDGGSGWKMIGSYTSYSINTPFTGVYDGNGKTISGLYINRPSTDGVAFFAYTGGAEIKNLGLIGVYFVGNEAVSALVGRTNTNTTISNCFSKGSISSGSYYGMVGGLIGYHAGSSTLSNSYSMASITGTYPTGTQSLGGLIGATHTSTVTNCYSTGLVSGGTVYYGGLIGYSMATINNCFWDTETSGQATSHGGATGKTTAEMQEASLFILAGWDFMDETVNGTKDDWGINAAENSGYPFLAWQGYTNDVELSLSTQFVTNISTSLSTATANGTIYTLGSLSPTQHGVCWNTTGNPTIDDDSTEAGVPSAGTFTSQMTGLTLHEVYYVRAYATNSNETVYGNEVSFAMTSAVAPSAGNGSSTTPYQIANFENLLWLSESTSEWGKYFIQTANIDASITVHLNEGSGFSPIGTYDWGNWAVSFQGNYNGQGFTIDGLSMNRTEHDYNALFGFLYGSATVQNLGVTNADISGNGVATLVGAVYSSSVTISNCYASGTVTSVSGYNGGLVGLLAYGTLQRCYSDVDVAGTSYTGGLIGRVQGGKVYNSYSIGSVTQNSSVSSLVYAGGLAGAIDNSAIVSNCFSMGLVSNANTLGGLIANFSSSTATNCFWDTETSGRATSAAGTGLTTTQMNTYSPFFTNGWDFKGETTNGTNEIWNVGNSRNNGYPYLNWQYPTDPAAFITWDGSTSSDWNTAGNWSPEIIPSDFNHVTIPNVTNKTLVSNTSVCKDLKIETGALLTISPTGKMSVSGTLTNNVGTSGLIIESDASGTGKLVNHTAGVQATIEQFITDDCWHYMGIPLTETPTALSAFKGLYVTRNDESSAETETETGWSYLATTDLISSGKGYGIYHATGDTTVSVTGTLVAGNKVVNTTFTNEGWNFIANPYPCTIDWDVLKVSGLSNVLDAIYVYDPATANYAYYVGGIQGGAATQDKNLAPMQGFFVKANIGAGSVTFNTASKTVGATTFKSAEIQSIIRLTAFDAENRKDESVICIHTKATDQFDGSFDAYKLKATSSLTPQLYSVYNGDEYSINSISEITDKTVIPLELMIKNTGQHTISLTELTGYNYAYPVVLLNSSNEVVAYLETEDYTFTAKAGETIKMFLAFSTAVSVKEVLQKNMFATGINRQIMIGRMDNVPSEVTVYNLSGQMVHHKRNVETNELTIPVSKQGVYMVRVQPENGRVFNGKTIINF